MRKVDLEPKNRLVQSQNKWDKLDGDFGVQNGHPRGRNQEQNRLERIKRDKTYCR